MESRSQRGWNASQADGPRAAMLGRYQLIRHTLTRVQGHEDNSKDSAAMNGDPPPLHGLPAQKGSADRSQCAVEDPAAQNVTAPYQL